MESIIFKAHYLRISSALTDYNGNNWGYFKIQSISTGAKFVEFHDIFKRERINIYSGSPAAWSGWTIPNTETLVTQEQLRGCN